MPEGKEGSPAAMNRTAVERKSDRELVVTRTFNAPAHIVFEAWSKPELFKRWWVPKSVGMSLLSCDMDVRTGGAYRFVFSHPAFDQPMAFFGTYREVTPNKRLVWTNEESDQGAVTTVTFEENAGKTLVTLHELIPQRKLSTPSRRRSSAVRRRRSCCQRTHDAPRGGRLALSTASPMGVARRQAEASDPRLEAQHRPSDASIAARMVDRRDLRPSGAAWRRGSWAEKASLSTPA